MGISESETQEGVHCEEDCQQGMGLPDELVQESIATVEARGQKQEQKEANRESRKDRESRSGFIHGLSVGIGIGCLATFVVMWLTIFFTPRLPSTITYESMLAIFIYPLIYLLAVGLIALTAGSVREYYSVKRDF